MHDRSCAEEQIGLEEAVQQQVEDAEMYWRGRGRRR